MDNERLMGIGLTLLTVALWVGPIAVAFGSNGWDVKETILPPDDQIEGIQDEIEGVASKAENIKDNVEVVDNEFSVDEVSLTINFTSPLTSEEEPLDTIKLKKMEAKISDNQGEIVTLKLGQETEIGPKESEEITFSGEPTSHGKTLIQDNDFESLKDAEISGVLKFEIGGLSLELSLENMVDDSSEVSL